MPKNNSQTTKKEYPEVLFLKLLTLVVIISLPVIFMLIDLSTNLARLSTKITQNKGTSGQPQNGANDYNFTASLPSDKIGNLSNVSQEKIDSLFNNLKK